MLSGWKKMLQDVSESVANLASTAVADATISASLNLPALQSSNDADAWHSLGAHHRTCLHAISDNQNKNHVAIGQTSALLSAATSTLQARDALMGGIQQDIDFVSESKISLASLASELSAMSSDLNMLTNFLAAFREAHISRTVTKLKNDADADLVRAQKNCHARITAAARARDLNLDKSIYAAKPAAAAPSSSAPSAAKQQLAPQADGFIPPAPSSQSDGGLNTTEQAPEAAIASASHEGSGENVVIDFEELLSSDQDVALPPASVEAGGDGATGE
jgi:hypothetical protein